MIILFIFIVGLCIWGSFFVFETKNKISIFGLVGVITVAFTSVLTVTMNNKKAKEREYEFHVLKEKQKVYDHFYNSFFEIFKRTINGKSGLTQKATDEMMLFKQGLMNWGSEKLIKKYIEYDNKLAKLDDFNMLIDGNNFLKEIRKDMGFEDSKDLNLIEIILNPEARNELKEYEKTLKD